jgi:hypothetical protein
VADPITTLPDGTPLTDKFKVPLTEVTTDQFGNPFADSVTWAQDDAVNFTLADITGTSVTVVPGDFAEGSTMTVTVMATDAAGLSASQVISFAGTVVAPVATAIEITAGAPEPK